MEVPLEGPPSQPAAAAPSPHGAPHAHAPQAMPMVHQQPASAAEAHAPPSRLVVPTVSDEKKALLAQQRAAQEAAIAEQMAALRAAQAAAAARAAAEGKSGEISTEVNA